MVLHGLTGRSLSGKVGYEPRHQNVKHGQGLLEKHWHTLLLVLGLIILFVAIVWAATKLTDVNFTDSAKTVQAIGTLVAICIGGIFAYRRFQVFRTLDPHMVISHDVSHRLIGNSYVHISVLATLQNSSKVQIELRKGFFLLQLIAPVSDDEIEPLYGQTFADKEHESIQWPTLEEVNRDWERGELVVEPGESHPETYEFIVSTAVESVMIYTYFYNPRFPQRIQSAEGWGATTIYDFTNQG